MKILMMILIILSPFTVHAEDNMITEQYNAIGINDTYSITSDIFPEFDSAKIVEDLSKGKGLKTTDVIKRITDYFFKEFRASLRICLMILVVGFLIGVLTNMQNSFGDKGVSEAGFITAYCVFAGLLASSFSQVIQPAKDMIEMLSVMIKGTIPILITLLTLSGGVLSSGLMSSGLISMVQVMSSVINQIVFPLIISSVALSIAGHMTDRINITASIKTIKSIAKWLLLLTMALYTGIFGVYGLAGSALDSSIGKATRFAIGSGIPIVGGVLSDSIETVIGTVGAVRNITGVVGIIVIIVMALTPIIKTAVVMWMFRLCCVVLEPVADKRLVNLTTDIADCLYLVFAVLISVSLLFIGCIGIILLTGNFVTG